MAHEFVIDRKVWLRGVSSALLIQDEKGRAQCCVGLYLSSIGVPDEVLLDVGTVRNAVIRGHPAVRNLPAWLFELPGTEDDINLLYFVNDESGVSDEEREARIAPVFLRHGVHVTFVD